VHIRVLLGLALAVCLGADAPQIPERARVLKAIETMFAAAVKTDLDKERNILVDFAEASDDVLIQIDSRFTPFTLEDGPEPVKIDLLGFYLAGAVQFDLTHPDQRDDALAEVAPALQAVLPRYAKMRAIFKDYRSPFLEKVAAQQAAGTLREFVQSLAAQPPEESPGTPGGPER